MYKGLNHSSIYGMSMCISTAQARAKCGPRSRDPSGARHFVPEFSYKMARVCISTVQAGSRKVRAVSTSGARHFPGKFSREMAPVTCPCAFRLRRLAQSAGRGPGVHLGTAFCPRILV